MQQKLIFAVALVLPLLLLLSFTAHGAVPTFVVNSTEDIPDARGDDGICETSTPGVCTLRAAVMQAFSSGGATVILPAGTFPLSLGEHLVFTDLTVRGAGAGKTEIVADAASGTRIFTVYDNDVVLRLEDLTLRDAVLNAGLGGAIAATAPAKVFLERCRITNCRASSGGAIFTNGELALADTVISDCRATRAGITTSGHGGAICLYTNPGGNARALLERCTLYNNVAVAMGGAVHLGTGYGSLAMSNCTVSTNHAGSNGGGIHTAAGDVFLEQVTMTGNVSDAFAGGGGISNAGAATAVTVVRSIVADNYDANGQTLVPGECSGALTAADCNIFGTGGTAHCAIGGTYTSALPILGPLQDNGGWTPTHALKAGSAGLDVPPCSAGAPPLEDQRGSNRPAGQPDLGAYERVPCGDVNGDGFVNVADALFLVNFLFAGGAVPPGLADVNQDGRRGVGDVLFLVNHLFAGGPAPVCPGT